VKEIKSGYIMCISAKIQFSTSSIQAGHPPHNLANRWHASQLPKCCDIQHQFNIRIPSRYIPRLALRRRAFVQSDRELPNDIRCLWSSLDCTTNTCKTK